MKFYEIASLTLAMTEPLTDNDRVNFQGNQSIDINECVIARSDSDEAISKYVKKG